jgi:hypothetical protein
MQCWNSINVRTRVCLRTQFSRHYISVVLVTSNTDIDNINITIIFLTSKLRLITYHRVDGYWELNDTITCGARLCLTNSDIPLQRRRRERSFCRVFINWSAPLPRRRRAKRAHLSNFSLGKRIKLKLDLASTRLLSNLGYLPAASHSRLIKR